MVKAMITEEFRARRKRTNSITKKVTGPSRTRKTSILNGKSPYTYNFSSLRKSLPNKIPTLGIRKPPQLVRWDLIIMFLCEIWGFITSLELPSFMRAPIYNLWGWFFKCKMDELRDPLEHYQSLQEFFTRPLKDGVRPICMEGMASPVDGTVLTCGEVKNHIEQVKGHSYTLTNFLGSNYNQSKNTETAEQGNKKLYQAVIYLAPGDYHRIHSPNEWICHKRRHFPGTLLPVAPLVGKVIPQLLALNERVVLSGEWDHGFYSLTAVGAYNVGSIAIHFDDVRTNNLRRDYKCGNLRYFSWKGLGTHYYERKFESPIELERAQEVGLFRLGSTVVLIFEAPDNFEFTVQPYEKIKMGQNIGTFRNDNNNNNNIATTILSTTSESSDSCF